MTKKSFTIGFCYFIYVLILTHYALSLNFDDLLNHFSKFGIYFAILMISSLSLGVILSNSTKVKSLKQLGEIISNEKGWLMFIILLLSHYLSQNNILLDLSSFLANYFLIHTLLVNFLLVFPFFLLAVFFFKKLDKKIIVFLCMILFIHGFYNLLMWHSILEQKQIHVKLYKVALKNNIALAECGKKIECLKISLDDFKKLNSKNEDEKVKVKINQYLSSFENKIKNSNEQIVDFSYLDNLTTFVDNSYQPIGIYDKKEEHLILDYKSLDNIVEKHYVIYSQITGIGSFSWILFSFLLVFWHFLILKIMKKRIKNEIN